MFRRSKIRERIKNVSQSFERYPVTVFLFLVLFILTSIAVQTGQDIDLKVYFSYLLAAFLTVVAQHMYERFLHKSLHRWGLQVGAILVAVLYYFLLLDRGDEFVIGSTRTIVLLFALGVVSMWIPTYQREKPLFHQMVVSYVKSFLVTLLYAVTLFLGVYAILGSFDTLIATVPYQVFSHVGNAVLYLFAPVVFLAGIPLTSDRQMEERQTQQRFFVPRVLEILLSYLLIPIMAVYTVILLIYIVLNFGGSFWQDSLLEPLLVSYAIGVIMIYLLACNVSNPISDGFRAIFPKVLLPIVLLQTVASVLKIGDAGITHGRYFVIMFGIFATFAAVLFSFFEKEKNGLLAPVLIVLAIISVVPPFDAFGVSISNQAGRLTKTLEQNQMIQGEEVVPKSDVSVEDKRTISQSVLYLNGVGATEAVPYLSDTYDPYRFFESKFGFPLQPNEDGSIDAEYNYAYLNWQTFQPIVVGDTTYMARIDTYSSQKTTSLGDEGEVSWSHSKESFLVEVLQNENRVMKIDINTFISDVFEDAPQSTNYSAANLTRTYENEDVTVIVLAESLERTNDLPQANLLLFITFH